MSDIAGGTGVSEAIESLRLFQAMTGTADMTWEHFFATVGEAKHPAATQRLMEYWTRGEGAAKIRWPEPCAFCRCLTHLTKYFPRDPRGLCANLEKRATGHWPNAEHSRTKHCPC